jgi:flagellar biosynthetic protein FliR
MTIDLPATNLLVGFLLALVRASAWLVIAPPFNTRAIPSVVKVGLAGALALPMASRLATSAPSLDPAPFAGAVFIQLLAGLALGFLTFLLFSAVQAAGELLDVFGGFTVAAAYDPLSDATSAVMGRVYQLLAVTLVFAVDGQRWLVAGFLRSYDVLPGTHGLDLSRLAHALTTGIGVFFVAAVEIAAPLIGALFLADVGLALLSRASPYLNVMQLGFPVKIMLTLALVGLSLVALPQAVHNLIDDALRAASNVLVGH